MADECQLFDGIWSHPELKELKADKFIKFANLVAAKEREACVNTISHALYGQKGCWKAMDAIRAREYE